VESGRRTASLIHSSPPCQPTAQPCGFSNEPPNHPAAGKDGITLCFDFGHHCPALPAPTLNAMVTRRTILSGIAILLVTSVGCTNPDEKPMQALLDKLSHGPETELPAMLFGYQQSSPGAREVLLGMLKVLRPPSLDQHMKLEASRRAGRFTMMVAHVPWHKGPHAYEYQPIILGREGDQYQVVGFVMPFNDIFQLIQGADSESINQLTQWYIQRYGMRAAGGG